MFSCCCFDSCTQWHRGVGVQSTMGTGLLVLSVFAASFNVCGLRPPSECLGRPEDTVASGSVPDHDRPVIGTHYSPSDSDTTDSESESCSETLLPSYAVLQPVQNIWEMSAGHLEEQLQSAGLLCQVQIRKGIAAQEAKMEWKRGDTHVPMSYVRFLQHAGARVVIIRAGEPYDYYVDLFSKLNGALFPGGRTSVVTSQYARTGRVLYNLTLQAYDRSGDIFPLWGTCLGFHLFSTITAGQRLLNDTDALNLNLPLDLTPEFRNSRMFGHVPPDSLTYLTTEAVAHHGHRYGLLVQIFDDSPALRQFYHVLTTNVCRKWRKFVSTIEAFRYPIYATQWHPEKNAFNWKPRYVVNHSPTAMRATQHFADFFIGEARKSSHRFPSLETEAVVIPENFKPDFYFLNFTQSAIQNMEALNKPA